MSRILVGRFGAPHGVRGELRLQSFTQDPKAIGGYDPLVAGDGRRFTLKSVRLLKEAMLVVRVDGIADRNAAEALTHVELFVDRTVLPPPDEEEFYIADLIGLDAMTADGAPIGKVIGVPQLRRRRPRRGPADARRRNAALPLHQGRRADDRHRGTPPDDRAAHRGRRRDLSWWSDRPGALGGGRSPYEPVSG